ncbi:hypothetical protein AURDEDRAFT_172380 [Auricularia subglabra TFB-10046 SS5]|nr:hypothetical protein AURDEDRAFT_172380 [Auricularia subglabra TFB-10046 SS5]
MSEPLGYSSEHSPHPLSADGDPLGSAAAAEPQAELSVGSCPLDADIALALDVPDGNFVRVKAGWRKHLELVDQLDALREQNIALLSRVQVLEGDAKALLDALVDENRRVYAVYLVQRRTAHLSLVELYKVTGATRCFLDDPAHRRALEEARQWRRLRFPPGVAIRGQENCDYIPFSSPIQSPEIDSPTPPA